MGRTYWSDIIRNSRTLGRLVWFHVPARISPKTLEETQSGRVERSPQELNKVMSEKRIALDMIHGYAPKFFCGTRNLKSPKLLYCS